MSTYCFHHIHLLHPFLISSPSHWSQPPDRACFTFLSLSVLVFSSLLLCLSFLHFPLSYSCHFTFYRPLKNSIFALNLQPFDFNTFSLTCHLVSCFVFICPCISIVLKYGSHFLCFYLPLETHTQIYT
jgi:hypothetical protein